MKLIGAFFMQILVGVDPDIEKNGVAIKQGENYQLYNLTFFELFDKLKDLSSINQTNEIIVFVECGELNHTVYKVQTIPKSVRNIKQYCANIGTKVGKNFGAALLIIQMCEYLNITVIKVKPTARKLDAKLFKTYTGITTRTNQEQRDAMMLVFGR